MVFNTATVVSAVTPAVIQTFLTHYLNRPSRAGKPTIHISYDEGINLIRQFLVYASHHTVEDIQRFTSQWVPSPRWVRTEDVLITQEHSTKAAAIIQNQLGQHGIEKVGGETWWQWRRPGSPLKAEWIEMRGDYNERRKSGHEKTVKRVMLYVHGGAYFFGSVDEHRYQMQRHARKLKARVFAPRYRLSPQFPFPCGLHDCLAAYIFLLTVQDPTTVILAGDSAGGGMVVSLLVCLRDQGLPLPAGTILISPWVDLTHSFPSVAGDNPLDYIPPYGFHHRPSPSWPPLNDDDMLTITEGTVHGIARKEIISAHMEEEAVQGFHVDSHPDESTKNKTAATCSATSDAAGPSTNTVPSPGHNLSIMIDGKIIEIKDQIQMYASNQLISHPLVSPILQPSLGGLPPVLILTGGGEMLRDEQIYLAHKMANPEMYPPGDCFLDQAPHDYNRKQLKRWRPTDVQLQVWDDLCHVAPTLSFTRPAKYMYRSIAQFGAWTLAKAQKTGIDIMDDDDVSVISDSDSEYEGREQKQDALAGAEKARIGEIGKAGDPLPPFKNHMIRQRVDRHGLIYPLEPAHQLPGCQMDSADIGVIKEGPVKKWMQAKQIWDKRYASAKRDMHKRRAKEMAEGYMTFGDGEFPPPSALAGRRMKDTEDREETKKRSIGMSLWALWGSKHDEKTMEREAHADQEPETTTVTAADGASARGLDNRAHNTPMDSPSHRRSRSRRSTVYDEGQIYAMYDLDESTSVADFVAPKEAAKLARLENEILVPELETTSPDGKHAETDIDTSKHRPKAGGIAFPFKLKRSASRGGFTASNASIATVTTSIGIPPAEDVRTAGAMRSGLADSRTHSAPKSVAESKLEEERDIIANQR